jgi:ATP-dependent Lon protease
MDATTYRRCRRLFPILPPTVRDLGAWLWQQGDGLLVELFWDIDATMAIKPDKASDVERLKRVLRNGIEQRADASKISIWVEAGAEPPGFAWECQDVDPLIRGEGGTELESPAFPKCNRTTVIRGDFHAYCLKERTIQQESADYEAHLGTRESSGRTRPLFVENPGAVALFSLRDAEDLFDQSEAESSRDSKNYIQGRIAELVKNGCRRGVAPAPSLEDIQTLRDRFPNATEVIDVIDRAAALARLSRNAAFEMPPLMILGDPGVGKTAVAQALAQCIATPFKRIDIGTLSTGNQLFGTSMTWSTGGTGMIFNLLARSPVANPIVFLDELDKAKGNSRASVIPPLLSLLEKETSHALEDEAIALALNASHIVWVATANDVTRMSGPLLSRMNVVTMYRPEGEAAVTVAREIYRSIRRQERWGYVFPADLDRAVLLRLSGWAPREMARWVKAACGEAARSGRTFIQVSDVPEPVTGKSSRIGFV